LDGVGQTNVGSVRINGSIGPGGLINLLKLDLLKFTELNEENILQKLPSPLSPALVFQTVLHILQ
jgi:hypothetical protein